MNPGTKYKPFPSIPLTGRQWPDHIITHAPRWCSVDLRDGNQALATPMAVSQKLEMFAMLVKCGFKEIEVGFPAASPTEYEFVRNLIEGDLIPEDVTIQVLVQAREDQIERTVESLVGAKKAIIHLYVSTSPVQRRIVFGLKKQDVVAMAVRGTKWVKEHTAKLKGTEVTFQFSPESFSATELEFSLQICEAVMNAWQPTPDHAMILNIPETVEVAASNVYADQVEWFCRHLKRRNHAIVSVHTHNDRGTSVAATESALHAGADRVEGTLFGNGERTGNLDIVIVALNLFTQGIDPGLDLSDLGSIRATYERCTGMAVPPRQPYSGDLVSTAFSGSHQDAIKKGFRARAEAEKEGTDEWTVPYLSIDPHDIGRTYDTVIRVNGQSGKGGVAYLLERKFRIHLPKDMQREFGPIAGDLIDALGHEAAPANLKAMLWGEYIERTGPYALEDFHSVSYANGCCCNAKIRSDGIVRDLVGFGNGPIDAFIASLRDAGEACVHVLDQHEHTLGESEDANAIAYIQLQFPDGAMRWGAGVDTSIEQASIKAIVSALNRK